MDRGEPSLVPEWLKGTSGSGSSGTSHHSLSASQADDSGVAFSARHRPLLQSQLSAATHNDYDSPRYSVLADRTSISSPRRVLNNNGAASDRNTYDRDAFLHPRGYSSFSRNASFRGYDPSERERDFQRVEKDRERELEFRDRDRPFGGDYRDRDRERSDSHQRSGTALTNKYETDATLRRSQSMIANRRLENGIKKTGNELGSITAPLVGGSLVSNMHKAAFERDFPSLGAEERQGSVFNSNTHSIWQGQGLSDSSRVSSPGLTITTGTTQGMSVSGVSVIGADGWSSALADAPVMNGSGNGLLTSVQQTTPGSSVSSTMLGPASSSGLNMAEALVQSPARGRTSPQLSIETQRLEELALKQSRQLIPMTPSMPKTMGLGTSEKSKSKMPRSIDSLSAVKVGQPTGSTAVLSSPLRAPVRPETPKLAQGGKLLVLKSAREKNGVSTSVKSDSLSPTKGVNTGNMSLGPSTAGIGGNTSLMASRKPKLLPDRKAVPMSSLSVSTGQDSGTTQRSKDSTLVLEEKRPVSQAQNRSDFFNALRRKASGSSTVTDIQEKSNLFVEQKADEQNIKGILNCEGRVDVKENGSVESVVENADDTVFAVEVTCGLKTNSTAVNGIILGEIHSAVKENSETVSSASMNMVSVMGGSEEEEAAFLRSLGWEENTGEEEALTEEEINAFYQEHMRVIPATAAFRPGSYRLANLAVEMHVGSLGSMSSGISSSDSEPDGESYT